MDHDIREPIFDLHLIFQRSDDHVFKTEVLAVAAAGAVAGAAPNADEWQYYIKDNARVTVFNTSPNAMTM